VEQGEVEPQGGAGGTTGIPDPARASARAPARPGDRLTRWLLAVTLATGAVVMAGTQGLLASGSGEEAPPATPATPEGGVDQPVRRPHDGSTTPTTPDMTSATSATTSTSTIESLTIDQAAPAGAATVAPTATTVPGRVVVAGDSVTLQAAMADAPDGETPTDVEVIAGLGWTVDDVLPPVRAAVAARPPDVLVVAVGLNDSSVGPGGDGWSDADVERFRLLIGTAPTGSCVVVVLPGHGPALGSAYAAEIVEARLALVQLAMERRDGPEAGPTVVVDWQAEVDARPDLLDPDGIHLARDPRTQQVSATAASVRTNLYWQGARQCRGG
jgi:hypothetical protein